MESERERERYSKALAERGQCQLLKHIIQGWICAHILSLYLALLFLFEHPSIRSPQGKQWLACLLPPNKMILQLRNSDCHCVDCGKAQFFSHVQ
jgi:hypothetical protein